MGRYLLSGLLLLAFGGLNAFAAENQRSLRLALVRFATRKTGRCANLVWIAIRRSLPRPEYARTPRYPNRSYRQHPKALSKIQTAPSL